MTGRNWLLPLGIGLPVLMAAVFELWFADQLPARSEALLRVLLMGLAATAFSVLMLNLARTREEAELSRALARHALQVQEEERRRLARELHDGLGQELYALKLAVQVAAARSGPSAAPSGLDAEELAGRLMEQVAAMARALYPPVLDKLGLAQALQATLGTLPAVQVECDEGPRLPQPLETALYRIAQEGVANALKHAQATTIVVQLKQHSLRIADDGRGLPSAPHLGLGLESMRERAHGVGANLSVESGPGTVLTVTF